MMTVGSAIDCLRQSHRILPTQLQDWSDAMNIIVLFSLL